MTTTPTAARPAYKPTTGAHKPTIDALWRDFRAAIDAAYKAIPAGPLHEDRDKHDPGYVRETRNGVRVDLRATLRDYVQNMAMLDKLDRLVKIEAENERGHRRSFAPSGYRYPISVEHGTKIILLHNASDGATMPDLPPATDFLDYRATAVEAQVIGWLIRAHVSPEWVAACQALDYADAVR